MTIPSEGKPTPEFEIRLRSAIPGRERWQVDKIRHRPRLAEAVQKALQGTPGVIATIANPMTGRILILYDARTLGGKTEAVILAALRSSSGNTFFEAPPGLSLFQNPLLRLVLLAQPDVKLLNKATVTSVISTLGNFLIAWCT